MTTTIDLTKDTVLITRDFGSVALRRSAIDSVLLRYTRAGVWRVLAHGFLVYEGVDEQEARHHFRQLLPLVAQ